MIKAFAHTAKRLVPTETEARKEERKADERLKKLERRQPQKAGPRQLYTADLVLLSTAKKQTQAGIKETVQKDVMKTHGKLWEAGSATRKARYVVIARKRLSAQTREIRDRIATATLDRDIRRARRIAEEEARDGPLRMSRCKFTKADFNRMNDKMQNGYFTAERVDELQRKACPAPVLPAGQLLTAIMSMPTITHAEDELDLPEWVHRLARCRDHLTQPVLRVKVGEEVSYYKFMFAVQNKVTISFSPFTALPIEMLCAPDFTPAEMVAYRETRWRWAWSLDYIARLPWNKLPTRRLEDISAIDGCIYLGRSRAASDGVEKPLEQVLDALTKRRVRVKPSTGGGGKREKTDVGEGANVDMWAKTLKSRKRAPRTEEKDTFYETSSAESADGSEKDDEKYAEAFQILEDMRARWIEGEQAESRRRWILRSRC